MDLQILYNNPTKKYKKTSKFGRKLFSSKNPIKSTSSKSSALDRRMSDDARSRYEMIRQKLMSNKKQSSPEETLEELAKKKKKGVSMKKARKKAAKKAAPKKTAKKAVKKAAPKKAVKKVTKKAAKKVTKKATKKAHKKSHSKSPKKKQSALKAKLLKKYQKVTMYKPVEEKKEEKKTLSAAEKKKIARKLKKHKAKEAKKAKFAVASNPKKKKKKKKAHKKKAHKKAKKMTTSHAAPKKSHKKVAKKARKKAHKKVTFKGRKGARKVKKNPFKKHKYFLKSNPFGGAMNKVEKFTKNVLAHDLGEAGGLLAGGAAIQGIKHLQAKFAPNLSSTLAKIPFVGNFLGSNLDTIIPLLVGAGIHKMAKNSKAQAVAKGIIGASVVGIGAKVYVAAANMAGANLSGIIAVPSMNGIIAVPSMSGFGAMKMVDDFGAAPASISSADFGGAQGVGLEGGYLQSADFDSAAPRVVASRQPGELNGYDMEYSEEGEF